MKIEHSEAGLFTAEFESEEELQYEFETNLSFGALRIPTVEKVVLNRKFMLTLRGPWGVEAIIPATPVAQLADGIALAIEADAADLLEHLSERLPVEKGAAGESDSSDRQENTWDRIRHLPQMEKILLASKAERNDRAVLLQDSDPRILLSLLRNPRLTIDEVARLARSTSISFQIVDAIMKMSGWMAALEVRLALINNPKTPQAAALRILPTLPEAEVRAIAKGGTSMALKQAALRRLQGMS